MKNIMKLELRRAFSSIGFWAGIAVGVLFIVLHFTTEIMAVVKRNEFRLNGAFNIEPSGVWTNWLGYDMETHNYTYLYYTILPILASLPYASSGWEDIKSCYRIQICARISRRKYLAAKYFTVFLSGGAVCTLPLVLDFLLCCLFLPVFTPLASYASGPLWFMPWADLFYRCPLAYVLLFLLISFCFGGIYACLGLAATKLLKNRFLIQFFPYIFLVFIGYLMMFVGEDGIRRIFSVVKINPTLSSGCFWTDYVLNFCIYAFLTAFIWMKGGKKHELY